MTVPSESDHPYFIKNYQTFLSFNLILQLLFISQDSIVTHLPTTLLRVDPTNMSFYKLQHSQHPLPNNAINQMNPTRRQPQKGCILIKISYHGKDQFIHLPVSISEIARKERNLLLLTCLPHETADHLDFEFVTFRNILNYALPYIKEREQEETKKTLIIPNHLEVIDILNATKGLQTYGQSYKLQQKLASIFFPKVSTDDTPFLSNYKEECQYIRLYLRWSIETIKIQYMGLYFMNLPIADQSTGLTIIVEQFYRQIISRLHFKGRPQFSLLYMADNKKINIGLRFSQYRDRFSKLEGPEWKLLISEQQDFSMKQLRLLLERRGINIQKLSCPISQQIMANPCYIQQCRHYFEQAYIFLAAEMHRKCPICKLQVNTKSIISDQILKRSIKCLLDEVQAHSQLSQMAQRLNSLEGCPSQAFDNGKKPANKTKKQRQYGYDR